MTKSIKTEAATVVSRETSVVKCLVAANKAGNTMLAQTREAAKLAAVQLDPAQPLKERLAAVMSAYSAELSQNHNVKAIFTDALTLLACGQTDVAVKVHAAGAKPADTYVKAEQAVDMSKHNLRDAAKQVREAHGIGRTKSATPKAKPAKTESAPDMLSIDAFSNWLDMMPEFLNDSVYHGKIVAALIAEGYTLTKAAKGKVIKGVASA